jgi:hypothetical protein
MQLEVKVSGLATFGNNVSDATEQLGPQEGLPLNSGA